MMKKLIFCVILMALLFSCVKHKPDSTEEIKVVNFSDIKVKEENKVINLTTQYYNIDKYGIICYYNRDEASFPMPNPYCFTREGKMIQSPRCYSELPDFIRLLIKDSFETAPLFRFHVINDSPKLSSRKSLKSYLEDNEILLLDDRRLSPDILPKSDYYFFLDWIWLAPEDSFDYFRQIDSLCKVSNNKITFIKVHSNNVKSK